MKKYKQTKVKLYPGGRGRLWFHRPNAQTLIEWKKLKHITMKEYRLYETQIGDPDLATTFEDVKQVVGCTGNACYLNFNGVVIKITPDMAYKDFLELYETRLYKET